MTLKERLGAKLYEELLREGEAARFYGQRVNEMSLEDRTVMLGHVGRQQQQREKELERRNHFLRGRIQSL